MITSVTTTVSTIVSSSAVTGLLASLGIAGVLTLIGVLVMKELVTTQGHRLGIFGRNLDTIILPLLFVFTFIVSMNIWAVLS